MKGKLANDQVIEKFLARETGKNDRGSLSSDGYTLWSYAMPIARWKDGGRVAVIPVEHSPSVTTSRHINMIARAVPPLRLVRGNL